MTIEKMNQLFAYHVEEAQFQNWVKEAPPIRVIYAGELGTIWKFTRKSWWQFVKRAIRNNGEHAFIPSAAMRRRPPCVTRGDDRNIYSSDELIHCVNPVDWTLQDWKNELTRLPAPCELNQP